MTIDAIQPLPDPPEASTVLAGSGSTHFSPIRAAGKMMIPVVGHGRMAPDAILVKPPGTAVKRGEILAEKWPLTAAAPLAPADGKIIGVGLAKLSSTSTVPAVEFQPDENSTPNEMVPAAGPEAIRQMVRRLEEMELAAGIEQLRQNGVWANRWTSPDLLGQLRSAVDRPVDTVLCNVLDESADVQLNCELAGPFAMELVAGTLALAALTGATRAWVVMAAFGDPATWEALRYATLGTSAKMIPLRDQYPQAHPSLLIHDLTGRHVRPARLPSDVGIVTLDAMAAVAVGRCFLSNEPMLTILSALHEKRSRKTHWLSVPIGMAWSKVCEQADITMTSVELRAGSPLREFNLSGDCVAGGGESSITAIGVPQLANPDPCIRCAWCMDGCPVRIHPAGLLEAAQQDDPFLADQYGLDACIECGICTYVCPSRLPILSGIRALRASNAAGSGRK